ncbi:MAG: TonB-dependent receptor [Mariprofundaceae bacterium]|nr:TonB-dependent receptor [Mariprofundaceae bacterium]
MNKKNYQRLPMVMAAILLAVPAQATDELPSLVVSAERIAQDPARISADITVIDRQEIEQSQATSVADLLRTKAGIHVVSTGGQGKVTSVFLRGGNSGHTLVLIDGVRVGSATVGSFDWGVLSTADIERIEIVRGAQSSLYGADAMGGVIQIFTRKGKQGTQVYTHAETGAYGTSSGAMSITGKTASDVSYALTTDVLRTDGVSVAAKGKEPDGYRQSTLSARLGLPVGEGELALLARNVDGKNALDGGFPFGDVLNFTSNTKQAIISAKLNYPITEQFETTLQLSRATDEVISHDPAGGFNNSDFTTRVDQLTWQNNVDLDTLSLLFGVDLYHTKGLSQSAKLNKKMQQTAAFTSLAWQISHVDVNASLRYDGNSASPNKTTYKLGLAVHPIAGLKLSANYGTGFKAPSLNDLYFPTSAFSGGNPNLKPETSKGWDVGIAYQWQQEQWKTGVNVVWFDQDYKDLIVWKPSVTFFYSPDNIGKARTKGLEISANVTYDAMYVRGNWTYLSAKDSTTGDLLPRRAKETGNISTGVSIAGLDVALAWQIVGPRFSSTGNTKPMAGYSKTDIRAAYAINQQWKLTARVDNLNNKLYEEVSGYGVLGRAWYAGASASF